MSSTHPFPELSPTLLISAKAHNMYAFSASLLHTKAFLGVHPLSPRFPSVCPPYRHAQCRHRWAATTTGGGSEATEAVQVSVATGEAVMPQNAFEFFRLREGEWDSKRTTHHLAFQRAESGESLITMRYLERGAPELRELMQSQGMDPELAHGGCLVTWDATLAWDGEGENHAGRTVFGLVPPEGFKGEEWDGREGRLIRDRGYAEEVAVVGKFWMDEEAALCLDTPYAGGSVEERFQYEARDLMIRSSTVRRFGGLASATFAVEKRVVDGVGFGPMRETRAGGKVTWTTDTSSNGGTDQNGDGKVDLSELKNLLWTFGGPAFDPDEQPEPQASTSTLKGRFPGRANQKTSGKMPVGSAFGSAYRDGGNGHFANSGAAKVKDEVDLSKVPPSMRADFEKSLEKDREFRMQRQSKKSNEADKQGEVE